jgi:hypothetical protein
VTGKVSYQGKPVKGGTVSFQSSDGGQSFWGEIKEDGTYEVPKILGGAYKVCVETDSLKPPPNPTASYSGMKGKQPNQPKEGKGGAPADAHVPEGYTPSAPPGAKQAENKKRYVQIPDKYATPAKTDLSFTANGGAETFDIELK